MLPGPGLMLCYDFLLLITAYNRQLLTNYVNKYAGSHVQPQLPTQVTKTDLCEYFFWRKLNIRGPPGFVVGSKQSQPL